MNRLSRRSGPSAEDEARARALQAALAEFSSIRARMDVFAQTQMAVFTAGVTAIGVIAGLALKEHGNPNLLLFISILAPILICTHSDLRNRIGENGAYIGATLWPYIQTLTEHGLPSWESNWEGKVNSLLVLVGVSQAVALLAVASVGALIARTHALSEHNGYQYLWVAGALLTVLSVAYSGWVFISVKAAKQTVPRR